jgi:adenylate cyclase
VTVDSQRRLVVILHADVIGSTALVRRDETVAHERILDTFRRLSKSIESYAGVTRELRGDALVGEFSRASDAVCAAIAFQEENAELNSRIEDEIQPGLRIGIAMGEVIADENTVTGAGVILAQRLEQLAERDGICIQGAAYETIPERLPFQYKAQGEHNLKGFEEPVRAFMVSRKQGEPIPVPEIKPPTLPALEVVQSKVLPPVAGASIAVMPFANLSGNTEQDYFSHGVTADIHSDLTRFRNLFVSGRSSCLTVNDQTSDVTEIAKRLGVQYLVRGSVRTAGDKLRINAELVDGESGGIMWSERYDRQMQDIFEIEVEVANTIAATLSIRIEDALYERSKDCPPERLSAYDWILRGNRNLELGGAANWNNAKRAFERAVEIDPESSTAHAGLSITYAYECGELLAVDYVESLERHHEFAEKALALDSSDSRGHYAMSCAHTLFGQFDLGHQHAERALSLNPSEYHNICGLGYSLMCLDRFDECSTAFTDSLRHNPLAPNSCLIALGHIEYHEGNYGQSAIALSRMTPSYIQRVSSLAATYAQLGYEDAARAAGEEFRRLVESRPGCPSPDNPKGWRSHWRLLYPWGDEDSFEKLLEGFEKAGLPV